MGIEFGFGGSTTAVGVGGRGVAGNGEKSAGVRLTGLGSVGSEVVGLPADEEGFVIGGRGNAPCPADPTLEGKVGSEGDNEESSDPLGEVGVLS